MDARELSQKMNYIGMERDLRKLALREKMATPEELAISTELQICEMILNRFEVVFVERERIGLIKKEDAEIYNKVIELIER